MGQVICLAYVIFLCVVWTFERGHTLRVYSPRDAARVVLMISERRCSHLHDWESSVTYIL